MTRTVNHERLRARALQLDQRARHAEGPNVAEMDRIARRQLGHIVGAMVVFALVLIAVAAVMS